VGGREGTRSGVLEKHWRPYVQRVERLDHHGDVGFGSMRVSGHVVHYVCLKDALKFEGRRFGLVFVKESYGKSRRARKITKRERWCAIAEEEEGAFMERSRLLSRKWQRERTKEKEKEGERGHREREVRATED